MLAMSWWNMRICCMDEVSCLMLYLVMDRVMGFYIWHCTSTFRLSTCRVGILSYWLTMFTVCAYWVKLVEIMILTKMSFCLALMILVHWSHTYYVWCTNLYFFLFPKYFRFRPLRRSWTFARKTWIISQVIIESSSLGMLTCSTLAMMFLMCRDVYSCRYHWDNWCKPIMGYFSCIGTVQSLYSYGWFICEMRLKTILCFTYDKREVYVNFISEDSM